MENKELVTIQSNYLAMGLPEVENLARYMVAAKMFPDLDSLSRAVVKILAGQELGVTPVQAIKNIHIIRGNFQLSANLMASKVKSSNRYDYRTQQLDDTVCTIDFYETIPGKTTREKIGTSTFTLQDAKKAGTQNLDKYPKNMLFARAMSNGVKWFTPDIFGMPVYVEGEIADDLPTPTHPEPEEGEVLPTEPAWHPEAKATTAQLRNVMAAISEKVKGSDKQRAIIYEMAGIKSRTELTFEAASSLIKAIGIATPEDLETLYLKTLPDAEVPDDVPF